MKQCCENTIKNIDASDRLIRAILCRLYVDKKKALGNEGDWTDTGSASHIRENLQEIVEFLGLDVAFIEQHGMSAITDLQKVAKIP